MKEKRNVPLWKRELLNRIDLAELLGISITKLQQMRRDEQWAPQPILVGKGLLWRRREVVDWINAKCPPPSQWRWHPAEVCALDQQIQNRVIAIRNLDLEIESLKAERDKLK